MCAALLQTKLEGIREQREGGCHPASKPHHTHQAAIDLTYLGKTICCS